MDDAQTHAHAFRSRQTDMGNFQQIPWLEIIRDIYFPYLTLILVLFLNQSC